MLNFASCKRLYVDIRGTNMRFMQARYDIKKNSVDIGKYGSLSFSQQYSDGGMLAESPEAVRILRNFLRMENIDAKKVYINISDPSIVLRIVKVPQMSERDLRDYLNMEISQFLPVDLDTSTFDFKVLEAFEEEDRMMMNVLLISVPTGMILNYMNLFKKAGLSTAAVDVYPNSIARLFGCMETENLAVVDVNGNALDFVILKGGKLFMHSNVILDGNVDFAGTGDKRVDFLIEEDEAFGAALNEVLNYTRTYLNFFSSRHFGKNVDRVYILGDITLIKNIDTYMREFLQVDVKAGFPQTFKVMPYKKSLDYIKNMSIDRRMTAYSSNLGLILRG